MNYLIGIDVGTSATKTVLFDEEGTVIASASKEYGMIQPQNGWAEQIPGVWTNAFISTIYESWARTGVRAGALKGNGLPDRCMAL